MERYIDIFIRCNSHLSTKELMILFAKEMCDKQKQICYDNGEAKDVGYVYYPYYVVDKELRNKYEDV